MLNPNRRDCTYPEKNLCGAGVALKLAEALMISLGWEHARRERLVDSLLKLVAIATVADVVPLDRRESRDREAWTRRARPRGESGFARAAGRGGHRGRHAAQRPPGRVSNRAAHQRRGTHGERERYHRSVLPLPIRSAARAIAAQLDELNKDRRETEDGIRQAILEQCLAQPVTDSDAALVFAGDGWHRGVVGIVASRVVERYHRPVFVLGIDDGVAYGSGRSIRAFHLLDALESMPALVHENSAGTGKPRASRCWRRTWKSSASDSGRTPQRKLTAADFEPEIEIDAEIAFEEITDQTVAELLNLAPFGFGNPPPTLVARGVEVAAPPEIKNDKHLFLRLKVAGTNPSRESLEFRGARGGVRARHAHRRGIAVRRRRLFRTRGYAPWQAIVRDVKPAGYGLRFRAEAM